MDESLTINPGIMVTHYLILHIIEYNSSGLISFKTVPAPLAEKPVLGSLEGTNQNASVIRCRTRLPFGIHFQSESQNCRAFHESRSLHLESPSHLTR